MGFEGIVGFPKRQELMFPKWLLQARYDTVLSFKCSSESIPVALFGKVFYLQGSYSFICPLLYTVGNQSKHYFLYLWNACDEGGVLEYFSGNLYQYFTSNL